VVEEIDQAQPEWRTSAMCQLRLISEAEMCVKPDATTKRLKTRLQTDFSDYLLFNVDVKLLSVVTAFQST
jgi:hypothetical protein